jgi:Tol biopolymer transport system component
MLQWVPGSPDSVLWNDRDGGAYVCRVLNVASGKVRTIPHPVYALSPDGRTAVATDFSRLGVCRPGYGYNGIPDPNEGIPAPADTGVFRVDLESGEQELIVSIRELLSIGPQLPGMLDSPRHWFNHLLWCPDGSRFVFLHRWQVGRSRQTRMVTSDPRGGDVRIIDANGLTSHFIWRDPRHILAFSEQPAHGRRFYLFEDADAGSTEAVGPDRMTQDGHCSYLPGNRWIVNDTYPDADRMQKPYLYHVAEDRVVPLGGFRSPPEYTGEWRCDTHPRVSPDGRFVAIDSPHSGEGRQLHLIDLAGIVGG